jgi:prepilin-type N-terminal cleavage/methylation domain-containing protein
MAGRVYTRVVGSEGFTLIEVLFVVGVIAVLSGIAVPSLLRGRASANETSTMGTLRALHSAQLMYALTCGVGLYAPSLTALGGNEGFLSPDLTATPTPVKTGYTFTLQEGPSGLTTVTDCHGSQTATEYYVTATPLQLGVTGTRAFASNHAHVIWQDVTGIPPVEPFQVTAAVTPIQ